MDTLKASVSILLLVFSLNAGSAEIAKEHFITTAVLTIVGSFIGTYVQNNKNSEEESTLEQGDTSGKTVPENVLNWISLPARKRPAGNGSFTEETHAGNASYVDSSFFFEEPVSPSVIKFENGPGEIKRKDKSASSALTVKRGEQCFEYESPKIGSKTVEETALALSNPLFFQCPAKDECRIDKNLFESLFSRELQAVEKPRFPLPESRQITWEQSRHTEPVQKLPTLSLEQSAQQPSSFSDERTLPEKRWFPAHSLTNAELKKREGAPEEPVSIAPDKLLHFKRLVIRGPVPAPADTSKESVVSSTVSQQEKPPVAVRVTRKMCRNTRAAGPNAERHFMNLVNKQPTDFSHAPSDSQPVNKPVEKEKEYLVSSAKTGARLFRNRVFRQSPLEEPIQPEQEAADSVQVEPEDVVIDSPIPEVSRSESPVYSVESLPTEGAYLVYEVIEEEPEALDFHEAPVEVTTYQLPARSQGVLQSSRQFEVMAGLQTLQTMNGLHQTMALYYSGNLFTDAAIGLDDLSSQELMASRDNTTGTVSDSLRQGKWHSFVQPISYRGGFSQSTGDMSFSGYGVNMGVFRAVSKSTVAGLILGVQKSQAGMQSSDSGRRESFQLGPFISWRHLNLFSTLSLTLSNSSHAYKRRDSQNKRLTSDFAGVTQSLFFDLGYDFQADRLYPGLTITPRLTALYMKSSYNSQKEKGESSEALNIHGSQADQFIGRAGIELGYVLPDLSDPTWIHFWSGWQEQHLSGNRQHYHSSDFAHADHHLISGVNDKGVFYGLGITRLFANNQRIRFNLDGSRTGKGFSEALQAEYEWSF